jgi:UDP-2,3-diacylglucosamine hydrolase
LQPSEPTVVTGFKNLLEFAGERVDKLFILGDLFEAWLGDDDGDVFNLQIIELLQRATKSGLSIYLMPGNRDFLLGETFAQQTGVQLLKDPTCINLYDVPTLLMHGDSLCVLDKRFQSWRRFYSNPLWQKVALSIPLFLRRHIGRWLRSKSKQHQMNLDNVITDVSFDEVRHQMQTHQVTQLIHGHTHRPAAHPTPLDSKTGTRYVLGAWDNKPMVLFCDETGCQLKNFRL